MSQASYRRGVLLAKRRALMDDWSKFCTGYNVPAIMAASGSSRASRLCWDAPRQPTRPSHEMLPRAGADFSNAPKIR